jgi:N-acetylneuraminic acid mutarotase
MKIISRKTVPLLNIVVSLYLSSIPCALAQGQWTFVPSMPTGRWVLSATAGVDGTIYAIGGFNDFTRLATVEAYDLTTMVWTPKVPMPTPRSNLAAAVGYNDGRVYVFGGDIDVGQVNIVEAYEPSTGTWSTVAPMPTSRFGLRAVSGFDNSIYVLGGFQRDDWGDLHALNTVEAYDPSTGFWSTRAPMPTARGALAAALGFDGRIYAIGGLDYDRAIFLTEVQAYDPSTDTWAVLPSLRIGRYNLAAATDNNGRIYALGGFADGLQTNAVEVYDPVTNQWTFAASMLTPREGLGAVTGFDGRIYAIGGLNVYFDGNGYIREVLRTVEAFTQ